MKHKLLAIGTILSASIPIVAVVSCGRSNTIRNDLGKHVYLYDKVIQDSSSNIHLTMNSLHREKLRGVPVNLPSHFGARMAAGGFGEERMFYAEHSHRTHLGIDVFAREGAIVRAPANGEVINAMWEHSKDNNNFAHGAGGTITIKVKIKDLNIDESLKEIIYLKRTKRIASRHETLGYRESFEYFSMPKFAFVKDGKSHDFVSKTIKAATSHSKSSTIVSKATKAEFENYANNFVNKSHLVSITAEDIKSQSQYVYITMIHLSRNTLNLYGAKAKYSKPKSSIEYEYSKKINGASHTHKLVRKGQILGYVGSMDDNGGWSTHTHVELYSASNLSGAKFSIRRINMWEQNKMHGNQAASLHATGTDVSSNAQINHRYGDFDGYKLEKGLIDPNSIYKFYDSTTKTADITL